MMHCSKHILKFAVNRASHRLLSTPIQHHIRTVTKYTSHLHHDDIDHDNVNTTLQSTDTIDTLTQQLHTIQQQKQQLIQRSEHSVISADGPFCNLEFALKLRQKIKQYNTEEHQLQHKLDLLKKSSKHNDSDSATSSVGQQRSYHTLYKCNNRCHLFSNIRRYTTTRPTYTSESDSTSLHDNAIQGLLQQLDELEQAKLALLDHTHEHSDITPEHQAELALKLQRLQQQQVHIIEQLKTMKYTVTDEMEQQYRHTMNKLGHSNTIRTVEMSKPTSTKNVTPNSRKQATIDELGIQAILQYISNQVAVEYKVYNIATRSPFHDYLIVVMANSARQMLYITNDLYKQAKQYNNATGQPNYVSIEGQQRSTATTADDWALVDLGSIMVYVFQKAKEPIVYDEIEDDDNDVERILNDHNDITDSTIPTHEYYRQQEKKLLHNNNNVFDLDIDSLTNKHNTHVKLQKRNAVNRAAESPVYDEPDDIDSNGLGWQHPAILRVEQKYSELVVPGDRYHTLTDNNFEYTDRESRLKGNAVVVEQ